MNLSPDEAELIRKVRAMPEPKRKASAIRIGLMVAGLLAVLPLTVVFGIFGFGAALFFVLLVAIAK